MARRVSSIAEVNDKKETWKLAIRVMNLWFVHKSPNAVTIEMVFIDEKGDKIHATVQNFESAKWKTQLQEGKTYIVQNFEVQSNDGQYRISDHQYKLVFSKATIVKEHDLPAIPDHVYHFTTFEDIISGHASKDVLVDTIGEFDHLVESYETEGKPKKVVLCLKDQRSTTLICTLWDEYASQMLRVLQKHESGPIVLLLTLAKIKASKGKYPISIQNTMYGSKLYINENIDEIQKYPSSLDSSTVCDSFSQRMTQLSSGSQGPFEEKFFQGAQVKSLAEINSLMQESHCITVGTIDKIFVANGWSYNGCPKCNKKCDPNSIPFLCACGKNISETIPRFRIEIKVSYGKESSKFVLWDREAVQLLKHTASNLKNLLINVGETNPMAVPEPVDDLQGMTLAFKIKVQPAYKRCSVNQVSEDLQIIESIVKKIQNDEDDAIVEKGKSACSIPKDDELYDSQSFSASAEFDPELLGSLTPAKRLTSDMQLDDLASQDLNSAQLSSTKLTKHIKTE